MVELTQDEQRLLERLGAEGKATPLHSSEIGAGKGLEKADLVFLVPNGSGNAVISRRLLAELEQSKKSKKPPRPPSSLLD
jgi:hypothetical protein